MEPSQAMADLEPWLETEELRLRDGVEVVTGAGGRTLLVSPVGRFLNVSSSGLKVLRRLGDGMTGQALINRLVAEYPSQAAGLRTVIPGFLADLRQADVLNVEPLPMTANERFVRLGKVDPVKRFPLVKNPHRYVAPVARALTYVPAWLLSALVLAVPLASVPLAVLALRDSAPHPHYTALSVLAAVAVMVCEIVLHECLHAVAMAYHRLRPKNAGIGLLFYFLPIAYVDRTDSYRHRGRFGRVIISLVGPVGDLAWAGVSSVVVLSSSGTVSTFFHLLLLLQLSSVLANLNPLFPTDGYHALESALGSINMRGRAMTLVLHRLTRRPLPLYLSSTTRRVRVGYTAYIATSLLYTLIVILAILLTVSHIVLQVIA